MKSFLAKFFPAAAALLIAPCLLLQLPPSPGFAQATNSGVSNMATVSNEPAAKFPAMVEASDKHPTHGKNTLPFLLSLARRPELMHPQYLRMVLGTPEKARGYSYPTNNFAWSPADNSKTHYYLNRLPNNGPGGVALSESRQFVVTFAQSTIRQKDVRAKLGKPTRRYYDNQAQPVELYQITPTTTLMACEPSNTFDVSRLSVCYNGPVLAPADQRDLLSASIYRQEQIDHHLDKGNHERGLEFLQEHLDDNPQDIEAHLLLAQTLKNRSDVNGAIAEYRRALALAQASSDKSMAKRAIKGLRQFGLVPNQQVISQQGSNPQ